MLQTDVNLQKCIESKLFFQRKTASFSPKNILFPITLTGPKTLFTKKTLILSTTVD